MARPCKIDDCGKPSDSFGLCKLHAARFRRHGDPLAGRSKNGDGDKFIEMALNHSGNGCLIWPFGRIKGYAAASNGKYVSRLICEKIHGPAPFPKAETLHECGNGNLGCVNPKHLRWGTRKENMQDMIGHGRSRLGHKQRALSPSEKERHRLGLIRHWEWRRAHAHAAAP